MELRHLRYFIAVAEERHITRAAVRLGMQQPPLSQQIKALENELGVSLLTRGARGVELTVAGQALLEDAYAILESVSRASARTQRSGRGQIGKLSIGFTTLPRCIRLCQRSSGHFVRRMVWWNSICTKTRRPT